jgi:hypothetical protein
MSESRSHDVGSREIVTHEEERLARDRRRGIRKAIAEIKSRAMAAFSESHVGPRRYADVILRKRNHVGLSGEQEFFQNKKRFSF